jgi:hypothetical protein
MTKSSTPTRTHRRVLVLAGSKTPYTTADIHEFAFEKYELIPA